MLKQFGIIEHWFNRAIGDTGNVTTQSKECLMRGLRIITSKSPRASDIYVTLGSVQPTLKVLILSYILIFVMQIFIRLRIATVIAKIFRFS